MKKNTTLYIKDEQGRILLQKRTLDYKPAPGQWTFFGGQIEKGESPVFSANRELREELGIGTPDVSCIYSTTFLFKNEQTHVFILSINSSKMNLIRLGEGCGFAFFAPKEVKKLKLSKHTKMMWEVLHVLDRQKSNKNN